MTIFFITITYDMHETRNGNKFEKILPISFKCDRSRHRFPCSNIWKVTTTPFKSSSRRRSSGVAPLSISRLPHRRRPLFQCLLFYARCRRVLYGSIKRPYVFNHKVAFTYNIAPGIILLQLLIDCLYIYVTRISYNFDLALEYSNSFEWSFQSNR